MPCRDGGDDCGPRRNDQSISDIERRNQEQKKHLDAATALLCKATKTLAKAGILKDHPELLAWHNEHEKQDAKRANEAAKKLQKLAQDLGYDLDPNEIKKNLK